MGFNLSDYEPVEDRIAAFYAEHPGGRIVTKLVKATDTEFIVKAVVHREESPEPHWQRGAWATGYARELVTDRGVNSTSALENCETSAIGRALANAGYAAKGKRPSREEMTKAAPAAPVVERITAQQVDTLLGLLTEAGTYPEEWKRRRFPTKQKIAQLPAEHYDEASRILTEALEPF